jgi:hypothetical protein
MTLDQRVSLLLDLYFTDAVRATRQEGSAGRSRTGATQDSSNK